MRPFLAFLAVFFAVMPAANGTVATHVFHHPYSVVYIENHAPSFPVEWAVQIMRAQHPDVTVYYGNCRSNAGCAKVYQMHRGRHTQPAMTYWYYHSDGSFVEPVITKYDLDYPWTLHDRYQGACHELQRELGLEGSAAVLTTCRYASLNGAASIYPNATDIRLINEVY